MSEVAGKGALWRPDDDRSWYQWGHEGRHHGVGTSECPRDLHHHHDERCGPPPIVRLLCLLTNSSPFFGRWSRR